MLVLCLVALFVMTHASSWTQIPVTPRPPARRSASSACLGDDFLIFGGRGQESRLSDVWRYYHTENNWKALVNAPVSGRSGSTMFAHDSANSIGIFGGRDDQGKVYNDLWMLVMLPSAQWERIDVSPSPPGRFGAVYFHAQNHAACIYGGKSETDILSDGWCFDIFARRWNQLTFTGTIPGPVDDAAFVQHDHLLYLFGGTTSATIFVLNTHNNNWHIYPTTSGPSTRNDTLMGIVRHPFSLQLFGGRTDLELVSDPQWALTNGEWETETLYNPALRWGATGCSSKSRIWMFGGAGTNDLVLDDLWTIEPLLQTPSSSNNHLGEIGFGLSIAALLLSILSFFIWRRTSKGLRQSEAVPVVEKFSSGEFE